MINLTVAAGLGNQMFQYAYARALSEELKDPDIVLNQYYNEIWKLWSIIMKSPPSQVNLLLNKFVLNPNVRYAKPISGFTRAAVNMFSGALIRLHVVDPKMNSEKYRKLSEKGKFKLLDWAYAYYEHGECKKKKKSVYGWFFTEKYFSDIRPILLKEFQFKEEPVGKNKEMAEELSSCNSVCVHIRRGDITSSRYSSFLKTPNGDYYKRGIEYISEHTVDPVFYIFSNNHDDIEWIKSNYDFGIPVKYVDLNNPGIDDLRLMYNCKHFVISKSSFSWWGSYMSQNENKIVIAPEMKFESKWLRDENMDGWYRKDMIRFHSENENDN